MTALQERAMYANPDQICGTEGLNVWRRGATRRSRFGDFFLVLFLLAQATDGVLTYVGVTVYGPRIEGNPIIAWLMAAMGEGPALTTAKLTAGLLGIALHLSAVHKAVAFLALFYVVAAICPWVAILFYF
jgi:hypothetical protein